MIWTNAEVLLIVPLGTNFSENFNRDSYIFIQENVFESVVCEMATIWSRPQCIKQDEQNKARAYLWGMVNFV